MIKSSNLCTFISGDHFHPGSGVHLHEGVGDKYNMHAAKHALKAQVMTIRDKQE